jgi:hypothetical protein
MEPSGDPQRGNAAGFLCSSTIIHLIHSAVLVLRCRVEWYVFTPLEVRYHSGMTSILTQVSTMLCCSVAWPGSPPVAVTEVDTP